MIQPTVDHSYRDRDLSTFGPNRDRPRHRWFEFKEGFSEELVEEACKDLGQGKQKLSILDPFSGSGTTLVTAGRLGHNCTGLELNPFLAFAARAKCSRGNWRKRSFTKNLAAVLKSSTIERKSPLEGTSTFTERAGARQWLFNLSVLRGFSSLDQGLSHAPHYKQPLRLGLFSSLMECCNAKRDGKCLRYRPDWQSFGFSSTELRDIFELNAWKIFEDLSSEPFSTRLALVEGDSRQFLKSLKANSFDLAVTSPPYLNSFDYSDVYRPELFVGGFVRSNEQLRRIRLRTIRSHVQASWKPELTVATPLLNPILKSLGECPDLWSKGIPNMVQAYFADMQTVFSELKRTIKPNGKAWVVVATSAYAGIHIPTDLLLADTASRLGWNLEGVYVLRQTRAAGQQWHIIKSKSNQPLRESLVVLKRL